ncbi:hypothetical protein AVEN_192914-1, partial [Araneus ventricosus]
MTEAVNKPLSVVLDILQVSSGAQCGSAERGHHVESLRRRHEVRTG